MRHIVSVTDVSGRDLERIFEQAAALKAGGRPQRLRKKTRLVNLFYQPSTRTRLSFHAAANELGIEVLNTENAREFSSAVKGESLPDSILVAGGYGDVIVLRHHLTGYASIAARASRVPLINAGDGAGEHPTQAFLDLFTIAEHFAKRRNNLTITYVGDLLRGRTVHSLAKLLAMYRGTSLGFAARMNFVAPTGYEMPKEMLEEIERRGIGVCVSPVLSPEIVRFSDVIYMTRPQGQEGDSPEAMRELATKYALHPSLASTLPTGAVILHPLPRTNELPTEWDVDPRAHYFQQAWNGVPVRTALLEYVLEL